jgi:2-deoxy-D-gluconate 3-dehydrogenase
MPNRNLQPTLPLLASLFSLKDQVVVVTGGAMGIGRAISMRCAEAGARVVIIDIDGGAAIETAAAIGAEHGKACAVRADLRRHDDVQRAFAEAVRWGGRIDVLVNNAGVFPFAPAVEVSEETWDRTLDVNLKASFFLAQAAAKDMMTRGHGAIVNIASIDALHPSGNLVHYDASKGGMLMMTRSLALELGKHGIRVNTICPGSIATPGAAAATAAVMPAGVDPQAMAASFTARVPLGRVGTPDDIATATLFLASAASSYVTGAELVVDGGYLLS